MIRAHFLLPLAIASLAACGGQQTAPEPPVEIETDADAWTHGAMVAAADPRAVQAGLDVIAAGGHAVDAAIAVHAVLGLVEPQSSGIGGGAFMLVYERETGELTVYDGRETAPAAATEDYFFKDGEVMGFIEAWQSGRAIGVPGQVALYKAAHDVHGTSDWAGLFEPAITLATDGFEVSPRLAEFLTSDRLRAVSRLDDDPAAAAYFYPEGEPVAEGAQLVNTDYAETLREIALVGPQAFYTGPRAERIVATATAEPMGSLMTMEDLATYQVEVRGALCGSFRTYRICSAPPPSSGGVTQSAILGLYNRLLPEGTTDETERLITWVDAMRLAYADRDHYVADPEFVPVPGEDLINPVYLDIRAGQVEDPAAIPQPGDPGEALARGPMIDLWGRDTTEGAPGTTHLSIVDLDGNVVSMTATVEAPFGTSRLVDGFLLNNQLTDFAREAVKNDLPLANAPAGGKRPRSSMSPTIVFDAKDDVFMVTGSPGGNSIVAYVSKTLVGVLDWGLSAQDSIDLPNVIARGETVGVEVGTETGERWAGLLREAGYNVREREGENSGLHVIIVREDELEGGADPRREGVARALAAPETE